MLDAALFPTTPSRLRRHPRRRGAYPTSIVMRLAVGIPVTLLAPLREGSGTDVTQGCMEPVPIPSTPPDPPVPWACRTHAVQAAAVAC